MRLLSQAEADQLRARFVSSLPQLVLQLISVEPCHIGQLARRVMALYPGEDSLVEQVHDLVDWYIQRGDVSKGRGGVLRCVPPYIIGEPDGNDEIPLYGDPVVEPEISQSLPGALVQYRSSDDGFERVIVCPPTDRVELARLLSDLGITIFSYERLLNRAFSVLDSVLSIGFPPPSCFGPLPSSSGKWEWYDPNYAVSHQERRWKPVTDWNANMKLVRWSPSSLGTGVQRRYFLYQRLELVYEITWEEAIAWQYALDAEAGHPVPWQYDSVVGRLEVNGWVPRPVYQVLRLLSRTPVRREGFRTVFLISPSKRELIEDLARGLRTRVVMK